MKTMKSLLTLFIATSLLLTSCSSDDDAAPAGPTPVQPGQLIATIDGAAYQSLAVGTTARIISSGGTETLNITAINLNGEAMTLQVTDTSIMTSSYDMDPNNSILVTGTYTKVDTSTFVSTSYTAPYMNSGDVGTITISEITANNIKGTFEFTPADQNNRSNTVSITAGAFDLPLQ